MIVAKDRKSGNFWQRHDSQSEKWHGTSNCFVHVNINELTNTIRNIPSWKMAETLRLLPICHGNWAEAGQRYHNQSCLNRARVNTVCMYVRKHMCVYIPVSMCISMDISICIDVYISICICTYIYIFFDIYMYIYRYLYVHIYIYMYYIYICIYIYIYIYIYILYICIYV